MRLGFTGTQLGMTKAQRFYVGAYVKHSKWGEFHHGDCIGADADFHDLVVLGRGGNEEIQIHPPANPKKRAFKIAPVVWMEKDYFTRNRDIIRNCDRLLATPKKKFEEQSGGTWYTIRYARRQGIPITIVWPSGLQTREKGK